MTEPTTSSPSTTTGASAVPPAVPLPGSLRDVLSGRRTGTPVVGGIAFGPVIRPAPPVDLAGVLTLPGGEPEHEIARYAAAVDAVSARLRARAEAASGVVAEVLVAQVGLVGDKGLRKAVEKAVRGGASAEAATVTAVDQFAAMLEKLGGLMAERVTDLRDLCGRLVAELRGLPEPGITIPPEPSVLLAPDLAPADTATLDPTRVVALATSLGGPTSHTAIIARQLGIPCVVAVPVDDIPVGTQVLVNGTAGEVLLHPDPQEVERLVTADRSERAAAEAWRGPGQTADGRRVAIYANVQDGPTARLAAAEPSEGVGLFRSELAFLGRDTEPSVEEQARLYADVLDAFGGRRVVIRTLDAGSDKPMKFATLPNEENPALGVRGLRLASRNPGLLSRQLDAIAQAAAETSTTPWVMAPMVATVSEAEAFAALCRTRSLVPGVMIEIPSAALLAHRLLEHVDFLSIGTNDLSQYTMAADRLSADLASLTDTWQPAVLHLVAITAAAGRAVGKPVGVCGEAAADPLLACVLVGLGVTSLSMAVSALRRVGTSIGSVSVAQCEQAAEVALAAPDPAAARAAAAEALGR
ncbi:MAG TPA: phosphoenolpyruvate--protein phosphotransferase [Intrasporangium sp.]|uniref:phosphoenolpyruvate--protein phosphotransferase n=1 Tax=Intrasporangium sp. TaxID=1925024 RepID=UPI002D7A0065|nr:phosphoenolpyruvate--protein phosphotransferase [Intrasporangium sp.]HET7398094.1 phosphoenolpyruvate--protein phosphotransferase [Intrasporangium sp.]